MRTQSTYVSYVSFRALQKKVQFAFKLTRYLKQASALKFQTASKPINLKKLLRYLGSFSIFVPTKLSTVYCQLSTILVAPHISFFIFLISKELMFIAQPLFTIYHSPSTIHGMRLVALYRTNSEQARPMYEFIEMFRRRYPDKVIQELDIDTREGAAEATLYGIMSYPALIATGFDGRVLGLWEGLPLPLIDEVAGAVVEIQATPV